MQLRNFVILLVGLTLSSCGKDLVYYPPAPDVSPCVLAPAWGGAQCYGPCPVSGRERNCFLRMHELNNFVAYSPAHNNELYEFCAQKGSEVGSLPQDRFQIEEIDHKVRRVNLYFPN